MNDARTAPDAHAPLSVANGDVSVVASPVLQMEPAHVAEAKRALIAQGRAEIDDDAVIRLLWAARCLPTALDVLADAHSAVPLAQAEIVAVDVELGASPTERRSLLAVGYAVSGGVIIEVLEKRALLLARDDDAPPCCVVRFAVVPRSTSAPSDAGSGEGGGSDPSVPVTRFTVGTPAR